MRIIALAISLAMVTPQALATTDSIHTVLLPIKNWSSEGYCQHEVLAADHIGSLTEETIIAEVLQRSHMVPALSFGPAGRGFGTIDLNPITDGKPAIVIEIEETGPGDGTHQEITVRIATANAETSTHVEGGPDLLTRTKLALVASLNNIFLLNVCAKVQANIEGLPKELKYMAKPLQADGIYTISSDHYWSLIYELSSESCNAGRPLRDLRLMIRHKPSGC
jgi:hypothetical protein